MPNFVPNFELQVRQTRETILQHAADHDIDSAVLMAALSDIIGLTAAVLDRQTGKRGLADRLASVEARARERYAMVRDRMESVARPARRPAGA